MCLTFETGGVTMVTPPQREDGDGTLKRCFWDAMVTSWVLKMGRPRPFIFSVFSKPTIKF